MGDGDEASGTKSGITSIANNTSVSGGGEEVYFLIVFGIFSNFWSVLSLRVLGKVY